MRRVPCSLGLVVAAAALASDARAFCGFYVSGADAKLTNNATQVVLMRDGTRTVLSMQNNYQGPPQDFAMVVPVPVVLQKENVKTLPRAVFDHVDQLTAPRLVEYWEQDPCPRPMRASRAERPGAGGVGHGDRPGRGADAPPPPAVKIEAQFSVGEYDIVVLSATDATRARHLAPPERLQDPRRRRAVPAPVRPDGDEVLRRQGRRRRRSSSSASATAPSRPCSRRCASTTTRTAFNLPIRLGLINSGGTQDLVVNILARNQRYEVANYDNVAIPTNIDVSDATRQKFGAFYAKLFDQTLEKHPRAVVTEYSWASNTCDPCPTPPLDPSELATLGADVLPSLCHRRRPEAARPSSLRGCRRT